MEAGTSQGSKDCCSAIALTIESLQKRERIKDLLVQKGIHTIVESHKGKKKRSPFSALESWEKVRPDTDLVPSLTRRLEHSLIGMSVKTEQSILLTVNSHKIRLDAEYWRIEFLNDCGWGKVDHAHKGRMNNFGMTSHFEFSHQNP